MLQTSTRYSLLTAAVLVLAACASPTSRQALTPAVTTTTHHPYTVQVKTGSMVSVNISNDDMKAALEAAIIQNKLFKAVIPGADYELSVTVTGVSPQPVAGTPTVEMEAAWLLTKASDRSVAMRRSIKSTGAATTKDAAVERAASNNISNGLEVIAELKL
jgi:hypothetical protein